MFLRCQDVMKKVLSLSCRSGEAEAHLLSVAYVCIDVVAHLLNLSVSLVWKTAASP